MDEILMQMGWCESLQRDFDLIEDTRVVPGRVMRENRGQYVVNTSDGLGTARLPGKFVKESVGVSDFPTVGDWLAIRPTVAKKEYTVVSILPRKAKIERQVAGKESSSQMIAANFDTLFLVNGLDGDFNPRRIQRYLSLAKSTGAEPVVVLNKADLHEDLSEIEARMKDIASVVSVLYVSAKDEQSLNCLKPYLEIGKTVALLGSSGVGKSTLINALVGEDRLLTQENRKGDNRGRHTTTWREMILLREGGVLIDLPGMRELQLTGRGDGIQKTFTDIEELASSCRFKNCSHDREPGCAVQAAIAKGELDEDRLSQFRKLEAESAAAASREAERLKRTSSSKRKYDAKDQRVKEWTKQRRVQNKAKKRNPDY